MGNPNTSSETEEESEELVTPKGSFVTSGPPCNNGENVKRPKGKEGWPSLNLGSEEAEAQWQVDYGWPSESQKAMVGAAQTTEKNKNLGAGGFLHCSLDLPVRTPYNTHSPRAKRSAFGEPRYYEDSAGFTSAGPRVTSPSSSRVVYWLEGHLGTTRIVSREGWLTLKRIKERLAQKVGVDPGEIMLRPMPGSGFTTLSPEGGVRITDIQYDLRTRHYQENGGAAAVAATAVPTGAMTGMRPWYTREDENGDIWLRNAPPSPPRTPEIQYMGTRIYNPFDHLHPNDVIDLSGESGGKGCLLYTSPSPRD